MAIPSVYFHPVLDFIVNVFVQSTYMFRHEIMRCTLRENKVAILIKKIVNILRSNRVDQEWGYNYLYLDGGIAINNAKVLDLKLVYVSSNTGFLKCH